MEHAALLMHKNTPVDGFLMNDDGMCTKVTEVIDESHIPLNISPIDSIFDVNFWMASRRVSDNRRDITSIRTLNLFDDNSYLPLHYVSLYDCYWIKYDSENISWNDICLYFQPIVEDVFSVSEEIQEDLLISRDTGNLTVPGDEEMYCIMDEDNSFYFSKKVSSKDRSVYLQKQYQEYIPTIVGEYMVSNAILYYSIPNITNENQEYIPFSHLYQCYKNYAENTGLPDEALFFKALEYYDIPDAKEFVATMIALDSKYQVPRDLCDFGVLRDPNTLAIKGFCPLFAYPNE